MKEKWSKLLKDRKAFCYMKTNMYRHESGYRCFEVGYCTLKDDGRRVDEKLVLSEHSDHFWHKEKIISEKQILSFSMDILLDGYIRLFNNQKTILTWENSYNFLVSSFSLEELE